MSDTVIKVEHLSKKYILKHQNRERYTALRDVITNKAKNIISLKSQPPNPKSEEFWALNDVSFEVKEGDRIGIIGKNGAGKSTLLKVLSRIVTPTKGRITIAGRVASLLEVGTGFHPELTGSENIFLNGSILGMSKSEIKNKFDEIVAFAEVEKFLDTPVKRYSSGMYVRLAFAVAAHLDPDILIVDEVLAVGDAEFQKKCLSKMNEVAGEGRTVLFVSHNLGAISQLCPQTIVLKNGELFYKGTTTLAIEKYLSNSSLSSNIIKKDSILIEENQFKTFATVDPNNNEQCDFKFDETIGLIIELYLPDWNTNLELAISLLDKHKKRIFTIHEPLLKYYSGEKIMKFRVTIPQLFITPGAYSWITCINFPGNKMYDLHEGIASFEISETGSPFARYEGLDYGCVFANYEIHKIA